ncbi:hypothetical protein PMAYCL1PPCAC_29260 [Pristionchus mayeri]|uniref:Uncharacterized protein n=1 Tax=Pristionchus mayeri TaxID=1317129 RepID=A0AAN5DBE0_9BILA|nr:hypothetical protein PMAYCL1PPCAC_29260 [Pristionchus mayeri]
MAMDAWLVGLSSGVAVFAFVFSLLTCTLFCCRDTSTPNSLEEKNDTVAEGYTEEIKRLLSRSLPLPPSPPPLPSLCRCDSVESGRVLRSQFPSRNASPSLHRSGSRMSRVKDPLSIPIEHARIDEEGEQSKENITSIYDNYKEDNERITPSTIVNCPDKVILPSSAPLHNSPARLLPKLSVTSPSFTNLLLLDGEREGNGRIPLVTHDTINDLPVIPNLRKSEERADNEMWEAKRRTWRGIVDAVDGCSTSDSHPSSPLSLPSSPLPTPRSISPLASVNVTATMGGCELGVETSLPQHRRPLRSETVV